MSAALKFVEESVPTPSLYKELSLNVCVRTEDTGLCRIPLHLLGCDHSHMEGIDCIAQAKHFIAAVVCMAYIS